MPSFRSMIGIGCYKKKSCFTWKHDFFCCLFSGVLREGEGELIYSTTVTTSVAYAEDAIRFHLCGNRHWLLILFLFHKFVVLVYCGQVECDFRRNSYLITYHS